jgi:DNA-binding CsgD family transcriptional regulator
MAAVDHQQSGQLERLNPAERDLLTLLGRGHTAKSIAVLRGLSVAAVNERFRSARRKTGLASSREIARLLTAQESRDYLIDLAATPIQPPDRPRPDALTSRHASITRRWRLIVITAALIAAALLVQQTATLPPTTEQTTSDGGPMAEILAGMQPSPDIAALHAEAATPSADPIWASEAEQRLTQRYHELSGFETGVEMLSVTCATTLCEVAGKARPDIRSEDLNGLMTAIQEMGRPEAGIALDPVVHHFSSSNDPSPSAVFVSYWRRQD